MKVNCHGVFMCHGNFVSREGYRPALNVDVCIVGEEAETFLNIPVYYYPQKCFPESTDSLLATIEFERENDKYLRGAEYFLALWWLSKCDSLIAGRCGGTTVALRLNDGKYKNQYLFTLGQYGIDDISDPVCFAFNSQILMKLNSAGILIYLRCLDYMVFFCNASQIASASYSGAYVLAI